MSDLPPENPAEPGQKRRGLRVAVIVIAILVVALIVAVTWLVVASNAENGKPTPTQTPTTAPTTTTPTASATTTPSKPATPPAIARCTVDELTLSLGKSNGAAGSQIVPILFKNKGSVTCELHGFPGVSLVGNGNGTQLGAPADQDSATAIKANTLKPGDTVQASLKIEQAANYGNCTVVAADGLRVYPPHSYQAVFVKASGLSGCSNADVHLMSVKPVLPQ